MSMCGTERSTKRVVNACSAGAVAIREGVEAQSVRGTNSSGRETLARNLRM